MIELECMLGIDFAKIEALSEIRAITLSGLRPFVDISMLTSAYCRWNGNALDSMQYKGKKPGKLDFFLDNLLVKNSRLQLEESVRLLRKTESGDTEVKLTRLALKSLINDALMKSMRAFS